MKSKLQSGFTLIELIVAIAVTGLITVSIINLYINIQNTQRLTYYTEIATRAGERQVESLRNVQYNSLEPDSTIDFTAELPADLPGPKSGLVAVTEPSPGLRRVDVTITYNQDEANERVVKQSSLIGVIGIGQ